MSVDVEAPAELAALAGRRAVITGVSSGLGRALAMLFVSRGADVVGIARRREECERISEDLAGAPGRFRFEIGTVVSPEDCGRTAKTCIDAFGGADILVNNAGSIGSDAIRPLSDIPPAAFDDVIDVNFRGAANMCRVILPLMLAQRDGVVINVASQAAIWGLDGFGAYSAAKAAMDSLSRTVAVEGWSLGVRANSIILGPMKSDTGQAAMAGVSTSVDAVASSQRPTLAIDAAPIAQSIAALCLPSARMITGASIPIDQALSAGSAMTRLLKAMASGTAV